MTINDKNLNSEIETVNDLRYGEGNFERLSMIRISILRLKQLQSRQRRESFCSINDKNLNSEIETPFSSVVCTRALELSMIRISILRLKRLNTCQHTALAGCSINDKNLNSEIETV